MTTKQSSSRLEARRGLLAAVAAAVAVWAGTLPAAFAGEHPEHPKAATPATTGESAESTGVLDGKVFAGEIGKSGAQTGDKDEFVFKEGKFVSTACVKYGFSEAPYVATEDGVTISFTSEPKNAQGETMSWRGVVSGNRIEGTALYQSATDQTQYWFKGTLKTAGSESAAAESETEATGSGTKSEHPEHPR